MGRQMGAVNISLSYCSGFLFALGLWLFIDGAVWSRHHGADDTTTGVMFYYMIPGFISTVAAIFLNLIPWEFISGDTGDPLVPMVMWVVVLTRLWLVFSFFLHFISLLLSLWLSIEFWIVPRDRNDWTGISMFLHNLLIFFASVIFRFGPLRTTKGKYIDELGDLL